LDAIDADLVAGNIVEGTTIFGVEGSAPAGSPSLTWQNEPTNGYVNWTTAMTYCNELEEGGYVDWRLPTYPELVTEHLTGNPSNQDTYWSSTESIDPASPNDAFDVSMSNGNAYHDSQSSSAGCARCVHE
jgi:hypothetical protein